MDWDLLRWLNHVNLGYCSFWCSTTSILQSYLRLQRHVVVRADCLRPLISFSETKLWYLRLHVHLRSILLKIELQLRLLRLSGLRPGQNVLIYLWRLLLISYHRIQIKLNRHWWLLKWCLVLYIGVMIFVILVILSINCHKRLFRGRRLLKGSKTPAISRSLILKGLTRGSKGICRLERISNNINFHDIWLNK
jgi:hypothetical protein